MLMQTRREFITTTGAGVVAATMAGPLISAEAEAAALRHGEIVRVSTKEMIKRGRPIPEVAGSMLERAMLEFTGKNKAADGWASLFSKKDLVGIKINCLGKPKMSSTPEVVGAIIEGLKSAGIPEEQIVVFDLFGSHMRMSRFKIRNKKTGVRFIHNKMWGYEEKWRKHPSGKVKFTEILLKADKIISVPVLKHHVLSGVTGALKNMAFGTIVNPSAHHRNNCDPGIANIYNLEPIKDKTRLIVCDGTFIQYDKGPQYHEASRLPYNSLLVTQDPVAMDKLSWEYIDELRKTKRKRPLVKTRGKPVHIATAAGLGLGTDDRAKIKLIEKTV
jgi:uncharacterized protein (DUF362 family)